MRERGFSPCAIFQEFKPKPAFFRSLFRCPCATTLRDFARREAFSRGLYYTTHLFAGAAALPTRTIGKYPVRVRTFSFPIPFASAVTSTRRNPGSVVGLVEW